MKKTTLKLALKKIILFLICIGIKLVLFGQFPSLPSYTVTIVDSTNHGYYFISPHKPDPFKSSYSSFNMILDRFGDIVYLKKFPANLKLIDFKLQPNNLISYYYYNRFYLMDSTFNIIDSVFWKNGLLKDPHDIQILPNGNFAITSVERVEMKTSELAFEPKFIPKDKILSVYCGVLQEQDTKKNVVFEWHSKDYFNFMDMDTSYLKEWGTIDWTHMNAIEYCADSSYLLSWRNFNEITKIDRKTGVVLWRLGGTANQFQFTNDSVGFIGQHDVRRLPNGNITLLDNGKPGKLLHPVSAKEYMLDEKRLKATLVWQYTDDPRLHSNDGLGNVLRINNSNTLINYGKRNNSNVMFNVIDTKGNKKFEIRFIDSLRTYRAFYYSELPFKLKRPIITCFKKQGLTYLDGGDGYSNYNWSSGQTTRIIEVKKPGKYQVFVPIGDGGFISSPCIVIDQKQFLKQNKK